MKLLKLLFFLALNMSFFAEASSSFLPKWNFSPVDSTEEVPLIFRKNYKKEISTYGSRCIVVAGGKVSCWGPNESGILGSGNLNHAILPQLIPNLSNVTKVEMGESSACALHGNGTVSCWGGIPGYIETINYSTPQFVNGLSSVEDISVGASHACAILSNEQVKCWPLGGTPYPETNTFLESAVKIDMGLGSHSCAVMSNGTVKCWGLNNCGQVGNGTFTSSANPTLVSNISNAVDIAVGSGHTCAKLSDATVKCWGSNTYGELGDQSTSLSTIPVTSINSAGAISLGAGSSTTCALKSDGLWCWGHNGQGLLGNNSTTNSLTPVLVNNSSDVSKLIIGNESSCFRKNDGSFYCWGDNTHGGIGLGYLSGSKLTPQLVFNTNGPFADFSKNTYSIYDGESISLNGSSSTASQNESISSYSWDFGDTSSGTGASVSHTYLRPGVYYAKLTVVDSSGRSSSTIRNIIVRNSKPITGNGNSCAIDKIGRLYCWGNNEDGQLLNNSTANVLSSIRVSSETGLSVLTSRIVDVARGLRHLCLLNEDGAQACWGTNSHGQIGNASTADTLLPEIGHMFGFIRQISVGHHTTCNIAIDGYARCWGRNDYGQTGLSHTNSVTYSDFKNTDGVVQNIGSSLKDITVGSDHACALLGDNTAYCWGRNTFGELGRGTASSTPVANSPASINTISGIKQISAGEKYTCAVLNSGTAYCWGSNTQNTIGDGTTIQRNSPTLLNSLTDVNLIATGTTNTCALLNSGSMKCWGSSYVGNGSATSSSTPASVNTVISGSSISVGPATQGGCFSSSTHEIYCWGINSKGQIGDNSTTNRNSPAKALNIPRPIALFAMNKTSGNAPLVVQLDASSSISGTGSISDYLWEFGDFTTQTGAAINHTFTQGGAIQVKLTVTDSLGVTDSIYRFVEVYTSPAPTINQQTQNPAYGDLVSFSATGYTGFPYAQEFYWDYGDGSTGSGENVQHAYSQPGTYTVTLTSTNSIGLSGQTTSTVTIGYPSILSVTRGSGFTCVLVNNGTVRCFGQADFSQTGLNTGEGTQTSPDGLPDLTFPSKVVQFASGDNHSCAVLQNGQLRCWGLNSSNQLGYSHTENIPKHGTYKRSCSRWYPYRCSQYWVPGITLEEAGDIPVGGLVTKVAVGQDHTCAILSNQTLKCWGNNSSGKLGYNSTTTVFAQNATAIQLGANVTDVALGSQHTCALLSTGKVKCWGNYKMVGRDVSKNIASGEVGSISITSAGEVALGANATKISAGQAHTCALLETGNIKCWGMNPDGRLGYGNTVDVGYSGVVSMSSIGTVSLGETVFDVVLSSTNTCVKLGLGKVKCWGAGAKGQNGNGSTENLGDNEHPSTIPYVNIGGVVTNLSTSQSMANGFCVVLNDGKIKCWGAGEYYQNGNWGTIGDDEDVASIPSLGVLGMRPVSNITANTTSGTAPVSINFSGTSSVARVAGSTIQSYEWNFGDGTTGTGQNVSHSYLKGGTYFVSLKVTDNLGLYDTKVVQVVLTGSEIVAVTEPKKTIFLGRESAPLVATAFEIDGEALNSTIDWISETPTVVTVDSQGNLTGVSVGTGTVKAKVGSKYSLPVEVTVKAVNQNLQLDTSDDFFVSNHKQNIRGWLGKTSHPIKVSSASGGLTSTVQKGGVNDGLFEIPLEMLPGIQSVKFYSSDSSSPSPTQHNQTLRYFDGVSGSLLFQGNSGTIKFDPSFEFGNGSFTLSFWLRDSSTHSTSILHIPTTTGSWDLSLDQDRNLIFSLNTSISKMAVADVQTPKNSWVNVAVTYDVSTNKLGLYINGILKTERTLSGTILYPNSAASMKVGDSNFTGLVDELAFWNRPLTSQEIKGGMFTGIYSGSAGLKFAFSFNHDRGQKTFSELNQLAFFVKGLNSRIEDSEPIQRFATTVVASKSFVASKTNYIEVLEDSLRKVGIQSIDKYKFIVPANSITRDEVVSVIMVDARTPGVSMPQQSPSSPLIKVHPMNLSVNNGESKFNNELYHNEFEGQLVHIRPYDGDFILSPTDRNEHGINWKSSTTNSSFYTVNGFPDISSIITYSDSDVEYGPYQSEYYTYFRVDRDVSGNGPYTTTLTGSSGWSFYLKRLICNGEEQFPGWWGGGFNFPVTIHSLKAGENICDLYYSTDIYESADVVKNVYFIHQFSINLKKL